MEGQFPFINPRGRTRLRGTFEVVRSFRQEIWWIIQYGLWVCLKIGYPQFQRIIIIIIVPITFAICGHPLFSNKPISQFSSSILVWFVQSAIAHSLVLRSMNAFNSTKWSVHVQNPGTFVFFFHVMPCPKLCNVNPGVADDDPINQLGFPKFTNPGFYIRTASTWWPKILQQLGWKCEKRCLSLWMFKISASNHKWFPVAIVGNCNPSSSFLPAGFQSWLVVGCNVLRNWVSCNPAFDINSVIRLLAHVKSLLSDHW